MSIASVTDLIDALHDARLLEPAQLGDLPDLQQRFGDAGTLARELVRRGWLTAYQAHAVFQGYGPHLLLGSYVLLDHLGEGGMGAVFKARNWKLGRTVALKVIRRELLTNAEAVRRFRREMQAVAQLDHPNVVHAYDAEEVGGTFLLVMEYVEGSDLKAVVRRHGPLPARDACGYARQAALGLQHAFERGLVHRDIKPSNLVLAQRPGGPVVKILDFGLARLQEGVEGTDSRTGLTGSRLALGTADYMAPEQAEDAHRADTRSDLYSLGCTLYHLLAGRPPFPGGTFVQKLRRHEREEPEPIERLRPDLPPGLAVVLRELMAKRPEDRYQTPVEAADALARVVFPDVAPPPAPERRGESEFADLGTDTAAGGSTRGPRSAGGLLRSLLLAAAGALVFLGLTGGLLALLWWRRAEPPTTPRAEGTSSPPESLDPTEIPPAERFDWQPKGLVAVLGQHRLRHWGRITAVAFQPGGRLVAAGDMNYHVRLWDTATGREVGLLQPHNYAVSTVAFTPDGATLASADSNAGVVRFWDVAGKTLRAEPLATPGGAVHALGWSPGGRLLAVTRADKGVRVWDRVAGKEVADFRDAPAAVRAVAFGPDGKTLAGFSPTVPIATARLLVWDVEGHRLEKTVPLLPPADRAAFSPDGRTLALVGRDNAVRLWDVADGKEGHVLKGHKGTVWAAAFSPDGKTLATGGEDRTARLWDVATGQARGEPLHAPDAVQAVAVSPDGTTVAGGAGVSLCLWDAATAQEIFPTTGHRGELSAVAVAPDGRTLASGSLDRTVRLWDLGTGRERPVLPGHGAWVSSVAFGPDGRRLASGDGAGVARVWDVATGKEQTSVSLRAARPAEVGFVGEGGTTLAVAGGCVPAASPAPSELLLWDLALGPEQAPRRPMARAVRCVAFAPDRRRLAWGLDPPGVQVWDLTAPAESPPQDVDSVPWCLAFTTDGRRLAVGGTGKVFLRDPVAAGDEVLDGGSPDGVRTVAFSPDGKLLASQRAAMVELWEVSSGRKLHAWPLPAPARRLAFADGRHLVTANANGTLYVLRLDPAVTRP
jgi:WD40 repeat protein/tRNA A-37 threonylcarbamoyl transferase component Bud32